MPTKAIVFDWDGTLFNSMGYKRSNFIDLFSEFSIPAEKLEEFHIRESGIPRKDLFNKCLKEATGRTFSEEEYVTISERYTQMNLEASKRTAPFSDVIKGLEELKRRKLRLFVSSSSAHDELTAVSRNCGLASYFDEVLGSQPGSNKGPEHINHICQKYDLKKEEIIFIGDDEQDLYLGKLAGVKTFRINRHSKSRDQISNITEIAELINV